MRIARFLFILTCAAALSAFGQRDGGGGTAAVIRALDREWVVGQSRNNNHALDLIFDNALV